jgi:rhomboid protease GluP
MVYTEARGYAIAMIVFGLIFPGIDNAAHLGGFAGGYLASMWLDPLKPERVNHMLGAVICLALTLLSIIASVATILPAFLRNV